MEKAAIGLLLRICEAFVVCLVRDAAHQEEVRQRLEALGLTGPKDALPKQRLLCCTTRKGKVAFSRQLKPDLYLDTDMETARELQPHLPRMAAFGCDILAEATGSGLFQALHPTPQSVVLTKT